MQQFEIDYENIFASVICFESLQVLFILTVKKKMLIHILNIQNAYLNSEFDKKIYIKISKNIENADHSQIFLLLKNLYELKQSVNL